VESKLLHEHLMCIKNVYAYGAIKKKGLKKHQKLSKLSGKEM
jgi:hypothetical protein